MSKKLSVSILIAVFTIVFAQTDEKNVTSNVTEKINATENSNVTENSNATEKLETNTTLSTASPLEVFCNKTKSCQQYNETEIKEDKYKDLRTRTCMCDEKCPMFGDCCEDSIHLHKSTNHNVSFSCRNTFFDGYVYMVDTCAPGYSNSKIIENCETTNQTDLLHNFLLEIPVTNLTTNITYKNGFCALCNNDLNFEFWEPVLYFKFDKLNLDIIVLNSSAPYLSDKNFYTTAEPITVLSQMKVDNNRSELVSVVKGITYVCSIVANIPNKIAPAIRYCLSDSNDRLCSICESSTSANNCIANVNIPFSNILLLPLNSPHLPKIDICDDIPDEVANRDVFCRTSKRKVKNQGEPDIESCFFMNDKKELCLVSEFYEPGQYKFTENGSLYVEKFHHAFPPHEYTNDTTLPDLVYVCGTEIPMSDSEKFQLQFRDNLSEVLIKFSIVFLVLYLATNVNKQKLQSLPNKILFSFCLTLLLLYLVFEIAQWLKDCKIPAAILHYLFLSCFTWLLVASYDFWQVICRSSTKLQTLAGKTRLKRYLIYCFFGWISPLSIMAVAIFFELSINRVISCHLKPGYGRLKQCLIAQKYPRYYFLLYPSTAIFCCIIALFAHTSYHIYLSKRKNIKSTAQNNYYMLFMKLALTMGLTWTIGLFVTYTDLNFFKTLYVILNASHGTLMFFAYGFKCTMLTNMYQKHKNNPIVQQTKSTFISITDKIRPSSQSATSCDPPTQEMESTTVT